jgi:hypothetical protein
MEPISERRQSEDRVAAFRKPVTGQCRMLETQLTGCDRILVTEDGRILCRAGPAERIDLLPERESFIHLVLRTHIKRRRPWILLLDGYGEPDKPIGVVGSNRYLTTCKGGRLPW